MPMELKMMPVSPAFRRDLLPDVLALIEYGEAALQGACPAVQLMARRQMLVGRKLNVIDNQIGMLVCRLQKDNPGRIREAMAGSQELARLKARRGKEFDR